MPKLEKENNKFQIGDVVDVKSKYMEPFQGVVVGISHNDNPSFEPFGTVYEVIDVKFLSDGETFFCGSDELTFCVNPHSD